MRKILFICKTGQLYGEFCQRRSTGLYTSTSFVVKALQSIGVECALVEAQDNNCIDRLVSEYKPDTVIIEALWVVPEKFPILKKLHPRVEWYVRLHSNIPFIAQEGISTDWISRYADEDIGLIINCERAFEAIVGMVPDADTLYLPNIYLEEQKRPILFEKSHFLRVGCFGAIRPMKNQLMQAMAALEYARDTDRHLSFYINGTRNENGGEPVLKSIRNLFKNNANAALHEVEWMPHEEFASFLHTMIDISMQVSLTETFNVVSADAVTAGIPIVVSPEVLWASRFNKADPHSVESIKRVMARVERNTLLARWNQFLLRRNGLNALAMWAGFAREGGCEWVE